MSATAGNNEGCNVIAWQWRWQGKQSAATKDNEGYTGDSDATAWQRSVVDDGGSGEGWQQSSIEKERKIVAGGSGREERKAAAW
ncbi:hypothetical protein B296_00035423 [Ensete ventricosum]|uniref:Uncharacterized protein n=1 Tax=Ensete ventricosum TaxID=4639 RepID=A0A426YVR7_ENSVE|nr:hypothetical protein B296_00035423 [Ensete ventricosum]